MFIIFYESVESSENKMGGVILENLSGKKLFILVMCLLFCQVLCFLIGALIAPAPSSVETVLGTKCKNNGSNDMLYVRGKGYCKSLGLYQTNDFRNENFDIVYAFQLPVPRDHMILDYSRWQQYLIGDLQFDIPYSDEYEMASEVVIKMDATLGYRNHGDPDNAWKVYASSRIERRLQCDINLKKKNYLYNCSLIPLFQLGSLYHDFYLLNIRIVVDQGLRLNYDLIHDLWLIAINQNGGFTKVWLVVKFTFLLFIVAIMLWSWNRIFNLHRSPFLLEYCILALGMSLIVLNVPVELLTLIFDMPILSLFQDIRQGVFYASLLSFWLVFAGEHMMIQEPQCHTIKTYWKHLSAVVIGCISLFIYDMFEKGAQVSDPFYSIWVSRPNLALLVIICAGISACVYFIFLCCMILKVLSNISLKRSSLSNVSNIRKLHYEGIIYRFKFLMLATIACAAMTIVGFIMGQVTDVHWKLGERFQIEYMSGFFTGVYGMWNIYIFALIILYSPSYKRWPSEADLNSLAGDEMKLNSFSSEPNEISLLTFAKKTCND